MSPVVLRQGKYQVLIHTLDHAPAHVRVRSADKEARIALNPVEVPDNWRLRPGEIRDTEIGPDTPAGTVGKVQ